MMTSNVSIRMHKPQQIGVGRRQRVASRPLPGKLKTICKPLAIICVVSILVAVLATQLIRFQVDNANSRITHLQAESLKEGNINVQLLAKRAQLTSKSHVVEIVGKKFGLQVPDKGQVHRM